MPATPSRSGGYSNYNPVKNTLVVAGIGGNPDYLGTKTYYHYFPPRFGVAYRLTEKTEVRTSFGVSYEPFPMAAGFPTLVTAAVLPSGIVTPTPNDSHFVIDQKFQLPYVGWMADQRRSDIAEWPTAGLFRQRQLTNAPGPRQTLIQVAPFHVLAALTPILGSTPRRFRR